MAVLNYRDPNDGLFKPLVVGGAGGSGGGGGASDLDGLTDAAYDVTGQSLALGTGADYDVATGALVVGSSATVTANNGTALGYQAAAGANGVAVGANAIAWNFGNDQTDTVALGVGATASANGAVALGKDAVAGNTNSVAIGYGAVASNSGEIRLGVASSTVSIAGALAVTGAAGTVRALTLQTTGSPRWRLGAGTIAESGSNAGSNLVITRYSDAGAALSDVVTITRSTGTVTLTGLLDVQGVKVGDSVRYGSAYEGVESTSMSLSAGTGADLATYLVNEQSNQKIVLRPGTTGGDLAVEATQVVLKTPLVLTEAAAPGTPASGFGAVYAKSADSQLYFKNDGGTEYQLTHPKITVSNTAPSSPATNDIWIDTT